MTEAFENMLNIWTEQMNRCTAAEKDYNARKISFANSKDCVSRCFALCLCY